MFIGSRNSCLHPLTTSKLHTKSVTPRVCAMLPRYILASIVMEMVTVGMIQAQSPSPPNTLDRAKQLVEIAAQKIEADIQFALREAGRLAKSDSTQAGKRLNEAMAILDSDQSLNEQRKLMLKRVVKDRLRVLELGPATTSTAAAIDADRARQTNAKATAEKQAEETRRVKDALTEIAK